MACFLFNSVFEFAYTLLRVSVILCCLLVGVCGNCCRRKPSAVPAFAAASKPLQALYEVPLPALVLAVGLSFL